MKKNNSYLLLGGLCVVGGALLAFDHPILSAPFFALAAFLAWRIDL